MIFGTCDKMSKSMETFNSAKVAEPGLRELCAPGSEHSSSKIQKTRNDGQMPQVPRILQTHIVHETHLHHEKAEAGGNLHARFLQKLRSLAMQGRGRRPFTP